MKSKHAFYTERLGNLYLAQGHLDDAKRAYQALLAMNPSSESYALGLEKITQMEKKTTQGGIVDLLRLWSDLLRAESVKR